MGFYIEGPTFGKGVNLTINHGATQVPKPLVFAEVAKDAALICVVDNGMFEAAGFCFDESEFEAFTSPTDYRPKTWYIMDRSKACELSGMTEDKDNG